MKITVAGIGYVGLAYAVLLSQNFEVFAYDIDETKLKLLEARKSPIRDSKIQDYLSRKQLKLRCVRHPVDAFRESDIVIISTPTDFDPASGCFDTQRVEAVIAQVRSINLNATIIVKSTVPVGFTIKMQKKYSDSRIIFSPEFLREGQALQDILCPDRIIVGGFCEHAQQYASIVSSCTLNAHDKIMFTGPSEAEAIKLFANTYLAMRVVFFNELDSFSATHNLIVKDIINGICSDSRIGSGYNNPSFGYGGYCLPKDTKQLLANFEGIPQNLIEAIVKANKTRKELIVSEILKLKPKSVGIYKLSMKSLSDNFRESAILDIARALNKSGTHVLIHEPNLRTSSFWEMEVVNDLMEFKHRSDIILANRFSTEIGDVRSKLYTRDIFGTD